MSTVYNDSTLAQTSDWETTPKNSFPSYELSIIFIGEQSHALQDHLTNLSSDHQDRLLRVESINQVSHQLSTISGNKVIVCDINQGENIINALLKDKTNTPVVLYSETYSSLHVDKALSLKADEYLYLNLGLENILEQLLTLGTLKARISAISGEETAFSLPKPFRKSLAKSLLDTTVALILLLLLSPLLLIIIFLIKIESRGPAFYVSKRVGTNYDIFDFYKFRTMKVGANDLRDSLKHLNSYSDTDYKSQDNSSSEPFFFKIKNDPRVTKIGRFLRKTSLDELPQLYNVLKGDMSLVGNRPLPIDEAASLTKDRWAVRFLAPSGITGLWQVSRKKESMTVSQRIKLDLKYRKQMSMSKDLKILLKTFPSMLQQE